MSISRPKLEPIAVDVRFNDERMTFRLADGRELTVPLTFFPRLQKASSKQRSNWELTGGGVGVHWPDIDEDISVENLLLPPGGVLWYSG